MTLFIVIPVKRLADAKSRLAPVLPTEERLALAESLLRHILGVAQEAQRALPARAAVISADPAVRAMAVEFGLASLVEKTAGVGEVASRSDADAALNAALEQAATWAVEEGADALLVLPADLPLVTLADLAALWRASQQIGAARAMVIAPDCHGSGTNALLVRPPDALRFQFGPDSFGRHCRQAQELGLAWRIERLAGLELDVDLPADLRGQGKAGRRVLGA
jgi:2-phospho-L-lactate guanylyltransferase